MNPIFHLLVVLALFTACKNPDRKNAEPIRYGNLDSSAAQKNDISTTDFYQQYEGSIAGKPVTMNVVKHGNEYNINYCYTEIGQPITLYQTLDTVLTRDTVQFWEASTLYNKDGTQLPDAKLTLVISNEAVQGQWVRGDNQKSVRVDLKAVQPAASTSFNVFSYYDSMAYTKFKKGNTMARINLAVLEPADKSKNAWIVPLLIKEYLNTDPEKQTAGLAKSVGSYAEQYMEDYKNEMDTLAAEGLFDNDEVSPSFNYEQQSTTNTLYNEKGYAVLNTHSYSYSGGAHGMSTSSMACFDMQQKKKLRLSDIVSIDSLPLQSIVEKYFRQQHGLAPGAKLTEMLFEDQLPANDNFYFNSRGLGFVYQPYEVAAYAFGIINVWVPYQALRPWLQPEFLKRMQL